MKILLVEDETKLADFLRKGLQEEYHSVDHAAEGSEGVLLFQNNPYDIVILDIVLPGMDGFELCKRIRSANKEIPILMLTARGDVEDRVRGLDLGADDYLVKPFAFSELSARVRALTRRHGAVEAKPLVVADLVLDPVRRTVTRASIPVDLTPREFSLLEYLMRNAGYVVTRTMISEKVWDVNFDTTTNVVDVHMNHLRKKVEYKGTKPLIHTVRGVGYTIRE